MNRLRAAATALLLGLLALYWFGAHRALVDPVVAVWQSLRGLS